MLNYIYAVKTDICNTLMWFEIWQKGQLFTEFDILEDEKSVQQEIIYCPVSPESGTEFR